MNGTLRSVIDHLMQAVVDNPALGDQPLLIFHEDHYDRAVAVSVELVLTRNGDQKGCTITVHRTIPGNADAEEPIQ